MFFRYQLGLHDKPIGVLNVANYWGSLIEWVCGKDSSFKDIHVFLTILQFIFLFFFLIQIQNAVKAGFVYGENKDILIVADDCETLLTKLQERAANKEKIHRVLPNV